MGYQYVQVIVAGNLAELSATAFRVFARMALVVRDYDNPETGESEGMYYGGWKGLTAVLGHGLYERNERMPANVERKIGRAIKELRDAGYLAEVPEDVQRAHGTHVYRLNVAHIQPV